MNNTPSEVTYSENIFVKKLQGYFYLMKPRVMILVIFTAFVLRFWSKVFIIFFTKITLCGKANPGATPKIWKFEFN